MDMTGTNGRNGNIPHINVHEFYVFLHMLTKVGFQRFDGNWYSESEGHPSSFSGTKYESGPLMLTAKELEAYSDLETAPKRYADSASVKSIRDNVRYSLSISLVEPGITFETIHEDFYDRRPVTGQLAEMVESFYDMVWEYHQKK